MRSENHQMPLTGLHTTADVNLEAIDERFFVWWRPSDRRLFEDYLQGYPIEEIARMQGISYTAVRIRLLRARRSVQSRIKERKPGTRMSRLKATVECQVAA
jgi:hypothetical protein